MAVMRSGQRHANKGLFAAACELYSFAIARLRQNAKARPVTSYKLTSN
jgi:hypothetical protein